MLNVVRPPPKSSGTQTLRYTKPPRAGRISSRGNGGIAIYEWDRPCYAVPHTCVLEPHFAEARRVRNLYGIYMASFFKALLALCTATCLRRHEIDAPSLAFVRQLQ